MENQNDFLFNSDYPVDKIVWAWEGKLKPYQRKTIAHGLGAVPFCKGICSKDGWNTTYQSGVTELDPSAQSPEKRFLIWSDGTNVYAEWDCYSDQSTEVTARIWGVFNEADTQNVDAEPTAQVSDGDFILNTDYKYPSLFQEGLVDVSSGNKTISHNLGYVPFCDIWAYYNNAWHDDMITNNIGDFQGTSADVILNNAQITFKKTSTTKYYYRIYAHDTTL